MYLNMRKTTAASLVLGLAAIIAFSSFDDNKNFEIAKNLDIYYTLFKELNNYYVDEIAPGEIIKTSIDEMLESLDPYTTYIPESKMEDYKFMTTGQYGGVGAMIRQEGEYVMITEVYENFPAQKADLRPGDTIFEIEGKSAKGLDNDAISSMLKGQPGTKLTMKIKRSNHVSLIEKEVMREKITISSVPYSAVVKDSIGYIILTSFTQNCAQEMKKAYSDLKKQGIKGLILDLRDNPGGLLVESVDIANIFIDKGNEIVSTRGKYAKFDTKYTTLQPAIDAEIPLVVLISRGSASASEIVSGSLQDLDRAVIIGQKSFGKGLVQTTRELSYNSKLKVTTAKYYIPSGRCIQALDYTHRNPDGSVGNVPDSLISAYKTKNGRTVYDGGGIDPDIKLQEKELSVPAYELLTKDLIFNFSTDYVQKHDSITGPETFSINDAIYEDFKTYVRKSNFSYKLDSEQKLADLIESAKEENHHSEIADQIIALETALNESKKGDLDKHKEEIEKLLASEIIGRYYFQRGQIIYSLREDAGIYEAIKTLQDGNRYNEILNVAK